MQVSQPSGSPIKSIQTGSISIANGSASATATVTSVNTAKSVVQMNGRSAASSSTIGAATYENFLPRVVITNATTITAQLAANNAAGVAQIFYFTLIEYA